MSSMNYNDAVGAKRSRSRSPGSSYRRPQKMSRPAERPNQNYERSGLARNMKEQLRINQQQEDEQTRAWVSQEDAFVLKQAKTKAEIRVREGRAKPIDWLTVTLRVIDPTRNQLDEDVNGADLDLVDPEGVFEGLSLTELRDLSKDIETFIELETSSKNRDFWKTMKTVCRDRIQRSSGKTPEGRVVGAVTSDIDKLLAPKTYEQLEVLEGQITKKLRSDEDIDVDYWEQLLRSLIVWKARAQLKSVYQAVLDSRLEALRKQQEQEAAVVREKLAALLPSSVAPEEFGSLATMDVASSDPEPMLELRAADKSFEIIDEKLFLERVASERRKTSKMGFVPLRQKEKEANLSTTVARTIDSVIAPTSTRFAAIPNDDFSQATKALYERELARGISENEEFFAGEEEVSTDVKPLWANKHRPRKPRYFNRVQMGYEWNKYNQTHYDHDNPPPKVVQGYKFNIFYPDLIDKTKAPTYRIEREGGRKRGQSFAPAGEEDTCLIRFISGAPYEDLAFRIVDKEWDYSAKRERGFKSSFDKGILQLHFQFKKTYYRK